MGHPQAVARDYLTPADEAFVTEVVDATVAKYLDEIERIGTIRLRDKWVSSPGVIAEFTVDTGEYELTIKGTPAGFTGMIAKPDPRPAQRSQSFASHVS